MYPETPEAVRTHVDSNILKCHKFMLMTVSDHITIIFLCK